MTETKLYNGEITLSFDELRHRYFVVNKGRKYKVPSVTAICGIIAKPALVPWAVNATLEVCKGAITPGSEYAETYLEAVWDAAKRASRDIKESAAERGKQRHEAIERSLSSTQSSETSNAITDWLRSISFEADCVERRIYSRRYRYSGTFDCLGRSSSGTILIDWKTSKSIYSEYRLQTAAYCHAYEEEFPDKKITGRYLVRIAEDGSVEPHFYPRATLRKDFLAFLGAKALFDRMQLIEKENRKLLKIQGK